MRGSSFFSASHISEAIARETLNRVNSYKQGQKIAKTPQGKELVNNFVNLGNTYPNVPFRMNAYQAMSGTQDDDAVAFATAMKTAEILAEQYQIEPVTKVNGLKRAFQVGILGLDSMFQPVSRGFKSAVVAAQAEGKSVPGTVALATLAGIPEILIGDKGEGGGSFTQGVLNAVLGDGVGDKYREARDAYGPTELTRYIQEKNKGNPINLGDGLMPNSVDLTKTQEYLNAIRAGESQQVAYNKAKAIYGRDITNAFDQAENRFKYTTKRGEKINISPGRIIASTMTNPGSTGYSVISGLIDGVFRVAADPMNLALMYGAGTKTAMRTMLDANKAATRIVGTPAYKNAQFWKGFLPGKTGKENRALYYGKTADEVLTTEWGMKFTRALADLSGDEGLAFLRDIKEFDRLPVSVLQVLNEVDDPLHIKQILETVAKAGRLTDQNYDDMFNIIKEYLPANKKIELDNVRQLTESNKNLGIKVLPYKPTAYGEFFNYMNKIITGKTTEVAPIRKFIALGAKDNPVRQLLGAGQQLKLKLPKHMQRALALRPETMVMITELDNSVKNIDNMLKAAFVDPKTRGAYIREGLQASSQTQLDDLVNRANMDIAGSIIDRNPNLKFDVEDIVKQQENFSAQMEELRSFFSGTAGSLAFNGTKIKKRYKTLIKDLEEYYERAGIKNFNKSELERYVYEAVPTMHLLSQATGSFSLLMDPQDLLRASKAHQQLIGPEESVARAWAKNLGFKKDKDWVREFKIPRRAYEGQSQLKPQGGIDYFFNHVQNNFLKPLWMIRIALLLRVVPEEGLRNAYAGNVNPFTKFLTRLSLTSNKYYEFFNIDRAEAVARIWNNTGELVMSTQMKPDDIQFMLKMLDETDVAALNAMDYGQAEKLIKRYLLETNYSGEVSEYMVNAAVNNFDVRNVKFAELTEKTFNAKKKTIKAEAKGAIQGYDGNTYNSMGEAILTTGGFSVDLSKQGFIDLGYRGPAEGDVFVSAYKNKEMQIGNVGEIEKEAAKYGVTPAEYLDTQIDNLFFDDDTVALLSKDKHAMGVYTDKDGNIMLDVAVGLSGDNAMTNAAMIGMNAFQESVYVVNRQTAIDAGFGKALGNLDDSNLVFLHYVEEGKGAKSINYDSVINKPALEALFKSNFDALKISVDEVKGAAQGLPGGSLMNNTPEYMSSMGEQALTAAFKTGRKDLIENMFIQIDKYLGDGSINPRYWEALWSEIELLATDPIAVRVANMGIDEAFKYFRNEGSEIIDDLIRRSFNEEDKIYGLRNAAGDKAFKEYLESVQYRIARVIGADHQILDPVTGIPLSAEAARQVAFKDGYKVYPKFTSDLNSVKNSQILEMIKTGGVLNRKDWVKWKQHNQLLKGNSPRTGNKSIKGQANQAFFKELIEVLTPEVDKAGLGPMSLPAKFDGTQRISESGTMVVGDKIVAAGYFDDANYNPGAMGNYKKLVDAAYDVLLAKPSSHLNRDPLFRYAFYENAIEAMAYMDDATRAEFLKGAEAWVDGNKLWDQLIEAAKQPAVENTITSLKQAEDILKAKAMEEVKTILYSTNQRHMASDLFNKYIPFPEIWAEVFQSWGKLIQENPQKFNKTRIAIDNGEEAKPWDSENGFLEEDPRTGKMMFNYVDALNLLSFGVGGRLLKARAQNRAFGEDLEDEGVRMSLPGYASGLNLIAQNGFAPGFGPLVTIPANIIAQRMPVPKTIQDFFLGSFGRGNPLDQLPAWLQKLFTGENTYSVERQAQFGTAVMDTYTGYVLAGLVDQTDQNSIDKYMNKAFDQAGKLFIFRGTTQFTLPTGIQPRIEVEDKDGTWWTTQALKSKYDELLIKNGYDYIQTDIDFEEKFGINPIPLTQAKNQSLGKKPVKEHSYFWWNQDNRKDILEPGALPNTGVYIQPDKIEDELYYPAFYEIESQNLNPRQYAEFMQQSQAIFELEKKKQEIRNNEPERNWEDAYADAKKQIQDEYGIANIYNFVGRQQRAKIETIMAELANWGDYELTKNSPEYPFVVEYVQRRNEVLDVFLNNGNYTYTNRYGQTETLRIRGSSRSNPVLSGSSDDYLEAQEIMRFIWEDIVAKSEGTNFRQLANEVLFYEISPVNPTNIKDR